LFYEGANYIFDSSGRQVKRISDAVLLSISKFAKEDLIEIYDKLSTHRNGDLKNFAIGLSESIKNGQNITTNFKELMEKNPKETRSPAEIEKARNEFIDKIAGYKDIVSDISKRGENITSNLRAMKEMGPKETRTTSEIEKARNEFIDKIAGYKDIVSDISKRGENITSNLRAMKEMGPKETRSPAEIEKARNEFIDKIVHETNEQKKYIDTLNWTGMSVKNMADLVARMYGKYSPLEESQQSTAYTDKTDQEEIRDIAQYTDKYRDDWNYRYVEQTNNNFTKDELFIINLYLKCKIIEKFHYYGFALKGLKIKDSGEFSERCLKIMKKKLNDYEIIFEYVGDPVLGMKIEFKKQGEKDIVLTSKTDTRQFGKILKKKRTSKKRTSKKRTSKKRTSKKRTSKKIKKL
jgi:predicted RNA-binding protein with PIN domain